MTITDTDGTGTDGTDGVDIDDDVDVEIDERPRFQWTWPKVIAVVLAFSFLAGAGTYLVSSRGDEPNAVDVGFLQDMIDHHDQAVTMAMAVIGRPSDPTTQSFAREVVIYQRWEVGVMDTLLADWGKPPWRRQSHRDGVDGDALAGRRDAGHAVGRGHRSARHPDRQGPRQGVVHDDA